MLPIHDDLVRQQRQKAFSTSSIEHASSTHSALAEISQPVRVMKLTDMNTHSPSLHLAKRNKLSEHDNLNTLYKSERNLENAVQYFSNTMAINSKRSFGVSLEEESLNEKDDQQESNPDSACERFEQDCFILAPTPAQLGKAPLQRRQNQGKNLHSYCVGFCFNSPFTASFVQFIVQ